MLAVLLASDFGRALTHEAEEELPAHICFPVQAPMRYSRLVEQLVDRLRRDA